MKHFTTKTRLARAAMTLLVALLGSVTGVWAQDVTNVTSETTTMSDGTYVVTSNVTISSRITINGNVTLQLGENTTLTASAGIELYEGNTLTIEGTGTLNASGGANNSGIGALAVGTLIINSGTINARGGAQGAGIGGSEHNGNGGTITINGGVVNAIGGNGAAGIGGGCNTWANNWGQCGTIIINGGQVTATGGNNGPGIGPGKNFRDQDDQYQTGSLVLGWTNSSDFIQTSSISDRISSVSFAEGKGFILEDGSTSATISNIGGHKAIPTSGIYDLTFATISGLQSNYLPTGSAIPLNYTVKAYDGTTLVKGTHFTEELQRDGTTVTEVKEQGTYTLTITAVSGSGYTGSQSVTFTVFNFVEIGNGTSTQAYAPLYGNYKSSYVQMIYTASQLQAAGISGPCLINKLAFNSSAANTQARKPVIYICQTDKSSFSSSTDFVSINEFIKVYDFNNHSDWTITAGWNEFELDTPFTYDGTSNLIVAVHCSLISYYASTSFYCASTDNQVIYTYSDSADPDPATYDGNWDNYSGYKNTTFLPNLKLYFDSITLSCAFPTDLEVSNITATSADVSWTSEADKWQICLSGNEANPTTVTTKSYTLTNLTQLTSYTVKVRTVCGTDDYSNWVSKTFKTPESHPAPSDLAVSSITKASAVLDWTENSDATKWVVAYKENGAADFTEVEANEKPFTLTGLKSVTQYTVKVRPYDYETKWSAEISFITAASIPLVEEFGTSIPTGWRMYTGMLNLDGTATMASATYSWIFGSNNGVFDNHARVNIYNNNQRWLVMPSVQMEDNVQLSFEVAYTAYSGTGAPAQNGDDDKFMVLVSTDNMATWTILRQWDNVGSEYVLNDLNPTPIAVSFDLSSYAGQYVIVAFYGESTESNADNYLHIDNVSIDYIPDCPKPTVLTVADLTPHTAQLSWTSDANAWQICLNDNEDNLIDVTTNPYTLENLADGITYTVKVRANCGNDSYSEWSNDVSFSTPIACPAPTELAVSDITGHAAKLNWTGNSEGYNVYYRTKVSVAEGGLFEGFKTTSIPSGWGRYNTLLTDDVLNGITALTTYNSGGWSFSSYNGVFDNHAKINIYSTNTKYWLVTPSVEVGTDYTFDFDLALTKYSGTLQPVDPTQQLDDKFVVLISTDDMATWTILRQWDNAGSEYVYDNIACTATGEHVSFDLSAYVGQNVRIAFYGESTVSGGDNNLHIDNVLVGIPVPAGEWMAATTETAPYILTGLNPVTDYEAYVESSCTGEQSHETNVVNFTTDVACPAPTGLTAANVGPTSVDLSWTEKGEATAWQIQVGEEAPIDVDGNPYTVTGLTPETEYTIKVRANGGEDGYSEWTPSITVTTLEACPVPDDVTVSDITHNSATVAWTGFNDSYVVSYRTAAYEDAPFKQDFENGLGGWTFTSMNVANGIGGTGSNPAGIYPVAAHSGSNGFRFSSFSPKNNDETFDQYLVSPELTVTGNLKFYFKKYSTSDETLYVGYSTTTNDLDAFTWSDDLAPTQQWQEYTQELPDDVKYIAFHYFANYKFNVYVDDITIGAYEISAGEWETGYADEPTVTLAGLSPNTDYEVKVQGFCNGDPTEESEIVTFTTLALLELADNVTDNSTILTGYNNHEVSVQLTGRKLWKDGHWNTLYLPFSIANINAEGNPLAGAIVRELNDATISGTTLTLNFKDATTAIKAGTPYIVKWEVENNSTITNPVFNDVKIQDANNCYDNGVTGDTRVRFIGTYDAITFNEEGFTEDRSILFMGDNNALFYPKAGVDEQSGKTLYPFIGACRAYFKIGEDGAGARQLTAFNLNFGDAGSADGIISIENGKLIIENDGDAWYTLDGKKLDKAPVRKGLYINNGRKVVVK